MAPWARHIPRRFNSFADSLANKGKALDTNTCVFSEFEFCCEFEPKYICAYWDSAYSAGSGTVGVGWWLRAADRLDSDGQPDWLPQPWFHAYGRCAGTSAAISEVVAFQCSVLTLDRLFSHRDLSDPLPPWSSSAWTFNEPENFALVPVKIEYDPQEDECSTIYESSCSESSSSSSVSSYSSSSDAADEDEFEASRDFWNHCWDPQ